MNAVIIHSFYSYSTHSMRDGQNTIALNMMTIRTSYREFDGLILPNGIYGMNSPLHLHILTINTFYSTITT